jgi:hypothetical protein
MFTIETLTALLGWATLINICILIMASISVMLMRNAMISLHGKMFGLDSVDLSRAYFQYIAQYKIAIFVLNLVPYIALRIVA